MTDLFQLTEDQLAIQDMAQKFTADRITPFAAQWDEEHHYPVDVWKAAGELGFGAFYVSEENGGIGLGRAEATADNSTGASGAKTVEYRRGVFGFANAGVDLRGLGLEALLSPLPLAVAAGLALGKQAGIFSSIWLCALTRGRERMKSHSCTALAT